MITSDRVFAITTSSLFLRTKIICGSIKHICAGSADIVNGIDVKDTKDRIYNMKRIDMGNKLPTYCLKVVLTAEDIYDKLSDEDKKI